MRKETFDRIAEAFSKRAEGAAKTVSYMANSIVENSRKMEGSDNEDTYVYSFNYTLLSAPLELTTNDVYPFVEQAIAEEVESRGFQLCSMWWGDGRTYGELKKLQN